MGKCGCFFSRATNLVSTRNSHSSDVRGLVVRWLLFNPEGSRSNRCGCANFLQAFRSRFPLFRPYETSPLSPLWDFFQKFICPQSVPLPFLIFFATEWMVPLAQFSALWDFSKWIIFVLNYVFSDPARYIRLFFLRPAFFMRLFSNLFSSKPPPQFF